MEIRKQEGEQKMARVKTAIITRKKHNKILKRAKGYYGAKHYRFRMAKQQVMHMQEEKIKKVILENYGQQE